MFDLVFFILLFSTSTLFVDGLICASDCDFSTQIGNVTIPTCTVIDKPDQNCRVELRINYVTGSIVGRLHPRTRSAEFNFETSTIFSLSDQTFNGTLVLDCVNTNNCDQDFVKEALSGDWIKTQNQVKNLRTNLADLLFNSSDLRPHQICPARQNCSDQGFCWAFLQQWSDSSPPTFRSTCANFTEQPLLEWFQTFVLNLMTTEVSYTCNQPLCASLPTAQLVAEMIQRDYILPFDVPFPSTTTITGSPTMSTTRVTTPTSSISTGKTTSSIPTSTKGAARSIHLNKTKKMILVFVFVLFVLI